PAFPVPLDSGVGPHPELSAGHRSMNMIAWLMGLKTISPAALHQKMQSGQIVVFDVNPPGSWINTRVPGARNVDPVDYKDTDLPADRASELVFYCSNPRSEERRVGKYGR